MLPRSFGILRFADGERIIERRSDLNTEIDPDAQLSMLTKRELACVFRGLNERKEIRNRFMDDTINEQFKQALKMRYRNRWNFLVTHRNDILPIDLQFFFNRNIEPAIIYGHG